MVAGTQEQKKPEIADLGTGLGNKKQNYLV